MAGEWSDVPLSELADLSGGFAFKSGDYAPSGRFVLRTLNISDDGSINEDDAVYLPEALCPQYSRFELKPADTLFVMVGATLGKVGFVREKDLPALLNQNMWLIRAKPENADSRFLHYAFRHAVKESLGWASGSARDFVRRDDYRNLMMRAPSLPEQCAIAHILGTLDDKIELNRRMNETLEAIARALFKSWFVDFDPVRAKTEGRDPGLPKSIADLFPNSFVNSELGKIPRGWQVGVLQDLTQGLLGGDWGADQSTANETEAALCIRGADIPDLQRDGRGKMPTRFLKLSSLAKRRLDDGDLVIEVSGGSPTQSTGRPVLVSKALLNRLGHPLVCSNFCRILKLKSPSASRFTYLWLRMLYDNDEFLQFENGTTGIKNFAISLFIEKFQLVIPPTDIMEAFASLTSPIFERKQCQGAEADTLAGLRDTLLPKLISGKLRAKDSERFLEIV